MGDVEHPVVVVVRLGGNHHEDLELAARGYLADELDLFLDEGESQQNDEEEFRMEQNVERSEEMRENGLGRDGGEVFDDEIESNRHVVQEHFLYFFFLVISRPDQEPGEFVPRNGKQELVEDEKSVEQLLADYYAQHDELLEVQQV